MTFHLLDSAVPLHEGGTLSGLCGKAVPSARFVFYLDADEVALGSSLRGCCTKCEAKPLQYRYVYGIAEGQSVQDEISE